GNATLVTNATTLDLIGNSATQGFNSVNLAADADIRMIGLAGASATNSHLGYATGSFSVTGNLTLQSAQAYPSTLSDFTLSVSGVPDHYQTGVLTFAGNGNPAAQVYSAAGSVTGLAPYIVQGGHLLAPFGQIYLGDQDTQSLVYGANSLTSVAGAGIVPFVSIGNSTVPGASSWSVSLNDGGSGTLVTISLTPNRVALIPERTLQEKAIVSQAQSISTDASAVLDASGGGSLYSYAFNAGKGGSQDVLSSTRPLGGQDTVFAINPNYQGAVAPVDGEGSGGLTPGQRVYLSGVPGLPAGYYTLLPAHYALLPGGFSISAVPNTRDMPASGNTVLPDGSMLVSGALSQTGSGGGSSRSSGFLVMSGKVIRSKSDFGEFDASSYFADQAKLQNMAPFELPRDGGYLAFQVNAGASQLNLKGAMPLGAAAGGRPGYADFTAPSIAIVGDRNQAGAGSVNLSADMLSGLGADSIVIGALRDERDDGTHLSHLANTVTLSNSAAHPLSGTDITLIASNTVRLDAGAQLTASGAPARTSPVLQMDGDSAVVRVSSGAPTAMWRNVMFNKTGTLSVASSATIASGGSTYLDATSGMDFEGQLQLAPGSALAVNARGIDLGSALPSGAGASGIQFGPVALDMLSQLSQISFNSYDGSINLYGNVQLGGAATRSLVLQG
ncbi:MAG: hypothetical protein JO370_09955, partial [Paucibacter sp.]|nr:hypothetical protein [Roseateles sp.]